ncbi:acetyl-coenzyme A transporter 1 isoform X2 [Tachypleus tridentatus]|uniref:acetyl-coenzyme A transporter 1 isoform X2 n=1 Tax=Tachypleus tridentatus TaxID=6853 RepID=UPI003FD03594
METVFVDNPTSMDARKRKPKPTPYTPSEETNFDTEFSLPHMPMHLHLDRDSKNTENNLNEKTQNYSVGLQGDKANIAVLFFLYVLQGIPLGLGSSIPMILQNHGISYKQQALFSFVHWPFSVKLLWAPVVDSLYSSKFGRRKSWLVPTQYIIGVFMLFLSFYVMSLLGDESQNIQPNVFILTTVFFMLNFLAATQDIALDGWALTMLSRRNVGHASTCNSVGQTTGYFLSNVVFLALESSDFCNKYLRTEPRPNGLLTLSGFLYFWGVVFLVTTTIIMLFKKESATEHLKDSDYGLVGTYQMLYRILCLPSVRAFVIILLTCKIGFSATDAVTGLKLIEAGVHKEHLALMAIPMVPLQVLLPLTISRYTVGPRPLDVFLKAFPFRLLFGVIFAILVWWTHIVKQSDGSFPLYYYVVILIGYGLHQVSLYSIFVAVMAFHARVSDPAIGGTYMTLLNTVTNLGGNWPATLALWFVDPLTRKSCLGGLYNGMSCGTKALSEICVSSNGECTITIDGYYIETVICVTLGFLWLLWGKHRVQHLQTLPESAWKCE